jgi:hypothetical protein
MTSPYSTVYSAILQRLELACGHRGAPHFAMYVPASKPTIMGAVRLFANQAMLEAGVTEMAIQFRAAGLRSAMYMIPALMVLCSLSLLGAARTVSADMQRMQQQLRG